MYDSSTSCLVLRTRTLRLTPSHVQVDQGTEAIEISYQMVALAGPLLGPILLVIVKAFLVIGVPICP